MTNNSHPEGALLFILSSIGSSEKLESPLTCGGPAPVVGERARGDARGGELVPCSCSHRSSAPTARHGEQTSWKDGSPTGFPRDHRALGCTSQALTTAGAAGRGPGSPPGTAEVCMRQMARVGQSASPWPRLQDMPRRQAPLSLPRPRQCWGGSWAARELAGHSHPWHPEAS